MHINVVNLMNVQRKFKIGDLVRHRFQPEGQEGHGIIVEYREKYGTKLKNTWYFKVKWVGHNLSNQSQWFPERELTIISKVKE